MCDSTINMSSDGSEQMCAVELNEHNQPVFEKVLLNLRRDRLASFVSGIRCSGHSSTKILEQNLGSVACCVLPKLDCGSYNAVLTIVFTDGLEWVLKIPAKGYDQRWTEAAAKSLRSEAQTMNLFRQGTTIPVPKVYAFDSSIDNELECPFILMEKVKGKPVSHGWFDDEMSPAKRKRKIPQSASFENNRADNEGFLGEQFRARCLQGVAAAMAQLNKFAFNKCGSLTFDKEGNASDIDSRYCADFNAFHRRLCAEDYGEDDSFPFQETGPLADSRSYFLTALDQREVVQERSPFNQGTHYLLRLFIDWALVDSTTSRDEEFVLAHPDFDPQNLFTDEEGTLTGIIDWDWVAAVSRSVGCLKLPNFLMKDFDPQYYDYDPESEKGDDECIDSSPSQLRCYRAMYLLFIENCLGKVEGADVTRRSLVMNSLDNAASNPLVTVSRVGHLFDEIENLTAAQAERDDADANSEKSSEADEDEDEISHMSLEECLQEIQNLTTKRSEKASSPQIPDVTAFKSAPGTFDDHLSLDLETQHNSASSKIEESYGRRISRFACGWSAKKLRNAADLLHRSETMAMPGLNEELPEVAVPQSRQSRSGRSIRGLCRQTLKSLKQVIERLYRKTSLKDSQTNKTTLGSILKSSLEVVLEWLKEKLRRVTEYLHQQKESRDSEIEAPSSLQAVEDRSSAILAEQSDEILKKAACGQIADMLRNDDYLTEQAQRAIARWVVRNLRSNGPQEEEEESTDDDVIASFEIYQQNQQAREDDYHKAASKKAAGNSTLSEDTSPGNGPSSDLSTNQGNVNTPREESYFDIIFSNHNRLPGIVAEDALGNPMRRNKSTEAIQRMGDHDSTNLAENDGVNRIDPQDIEHEPLDTDARAEIVNKEFHFLASPEGTPSSGSEAAKSSEDDDGLDSDDLVTEATSLSPATSSQDLDAGTSREPHDHGNFKMWDVCIDVSKGDLDERRMKRLREGFLALLNQTI